MLETFRENRQQGNNFSGARCPDAARAEQPALLPLFLAREERVGERRAVLFEFPSPQPSLHSFLAGRGRNKT
jgi:hypothetical protein